MTKMMHVSHNRITPAKLLLTVVDRLWTGCGVDVDVIAGAV